MSKKLSDEESLKSLWAINEYRIKNKGTRKKRVVVEKSGNTIFDDKVSVIAGDYNIYFKVDIIWEDANFDYKEYGLYGNYSSDYNVVTYDKIVLKIYSDDIIISII
ncbi:MAG: hypothetical protein K2O32_00360 [Acetatifactor sp.]|nr:hypothetical protein [Acetatifactor sp.]